MLRRFFKLLAVASLAICVLSIFLWIRSTWTNDTLTWNTGYYGGTTITSHRHALHWLSKTQMIGDRGSIHGLIFFGNSGDGWLTVYEGVGLRRDFFGISWAQSYQDEPASEQMPAERVRLRISIVPFPLIAGLTAIVPVAYLMLCRKKRAGVKPRSTRRARFGRMAMAGSLLTCATILFFWVRSIAFDYYAATFSADRAYSIECWQHHSAFALRCEDNPWNYRAGPEKSWSIACDGSWIPFGTDEMNLTQCVLPGPPQPFPGFRHERAVTEALRTSFPSGGLFGDDVGGGTNERPPVMMTTQTLVIPFWFVLMLAAAYPLKVATGSIWKIRGASRAKRGLCRTCGYDLRETPHRCPECGTIPKPVVCRSSLAPQQ